MQRLAGQIVSSLHYKLKTSALSDVHSEEPSVSSSCKATHSFGIAYASLVQGTYSAHFSKNFISRSKKNSYSPKLPSQISQGLPYDYIVSHEDNSTPFHAAPTQSEKCFDG